MIFRHVAAVGCSAGLAWLLVHDARAPPGPAGHADTLPRARRCWTGRVLALPTSAVNAQAGCCTGMEPRERCAPVLATSLIRLVLGEKPIYQSARLR